MSGPADRMATTDDGLEPTDRPIRPNGPISETRHAVAQTVTPAVVFADRPFTQGAPSHPSVATATNHAVLRPSPVDPAAPARTQHGPEVAAKAAEGTALPALQPADPAVPDPSGPDTVLAPATLPPPVISPQTSAAPQVLPPLTVPIAQLAPLAISIATDPGSGTVDLALSPEELGPLHMQVATEGETLRIVMTAERPETLDLLRRHADQLLADLRQAGFGGATLSFGQGSAGDGRANALPPQDAPPATGDPARQDQAEPPADLRALPMRNAPLDLRL